MRSFAWGDSNSYSVLSDGAIHGFMRAQDDPRQERDEVEERANLAAAREAWPRTVAFFREQLGIE